MAPQVDWDNVIDDNTLPEATYELEIEALKRTQSKAGALMYAGEFRVADGPHKGRMYFEYFNIGSADDPNADKPETVNKSMGVTALKKVFLASQAPLILDLDQMCQAAQGQHVLALIERFQDDGKRNAAYRGTWRNRVHKWMKVGERVADGGAGGPGARAVAQPQAGGTVTLPSGQQVSRAEYARLMAEQNKD